MKHLIILLTLLISHVSYGKCPYLYSKCNRFDFSLGIGPHGLTKETKRDDNGDVRSVLIEPNKTIIGGISYERALSDNDIIGVEVLSNQSYLIKLGKDF